MFTMINNSLIARIVLIIATSISCTFSFAQTLSVQDNLMKLEGDTMPEPLTIMRELLVTPDSSSAEDYILDKVAQKAKENRKKLDFTATTEYFIYASNMDLIPKFLSKSQNWLLKSVMGLAGLRAMYNYVTSNRETSIGFSVTQQAKGKDIKYTDSKILFSPAEMPEKVGKQVIKLAKTDLFDALYAEKYITDKKERHRAYDIEYIGSAEEEDGSLYYILKIWKYKGKSYQDEFTLHIADGTWGILRKENKSSGSFTYIQSRYVNGILLPAKCVDDPTPMSMEELVKEAEKEIQKNREKGETISKSELKLLERIEKVAKGGRRDAPMMKFSYEVKYH